MEPLPVFPLFRLRDGEVTVKSWGTAPIGQREQDLRNGGSPADPGSLSDLFLTACRLGLKATYAGLPVCTESKNEFLVPPPSQPAKILTMRMFTRRKKNPFYALYFVFMLIFY